MRRYFYEKEGQPWLNGGHELSKMRLLWLSACVLLHAECERGEVEDGLFTSGTLPYGRRSIDRRQAQHNWLYLGNHTQV